jgi:hypothetical protein
MKWVEFWVSETDQYGDIIDYTAQEFGPGSLKRAKQVYDGEFVHPEAVAKSLERVTSWGTDSEGVQNREYETVAERQRLTEGS